MREIFIGLDLGTQGARCIAVDKDGSIVSSSMETFAEETKNPELWWNVCKSSFFSTVAKLNSQDKILSLVVTSTSGTLICIDDEGNPLIEALMYNDPKGVYESEVLNKRLDWLTEKLGYKFNSSFGLSKILWVKNNLPDIYERTRFFLSPTDFINLKFTGEFGITDHSNALKFGFDLIDYKWPEDLDIDMSKLPKVVKPGEFLGNIKREILTDLGITYNIPLFTGLTDGTSGQIASGAVKIGEASTTLGTTLVIKGVTSSLVKDPMGRFYSHLHPEGYGWFPGGSSNVGGEALEKVFPGEDYKELDGKIFDIIPTSLIVYPLVREGERFPFVNPTAKGFVIGEHYSREELYAGYLEGVAYTERLCYETLSKLGIDFGDIVYTVGGGSKSFIWIKIRASDMNKILKRPEIASSAMGSAILGASRIFYSSLDTAVSRMVRIGLEVEPDRNLISKYEDGYRRFVEELSKRGYL